MLDGIDRVLGDFIVESQENLERLDHEFVALEHDPENEELLASIFRTIQRIVGHLPLVPPRAYMSST